MKRITILETRNGVIILDGEADTLEIPHKLAGRSWSFNSLDKTVTQLRLMLKEWRAKPEAAEAKGK